MSHVEFSVNGKKCIVTGSLPRNTPLYAYMRYVLALPGTKAMCLQAGCGACIVSVRALNRTAGAVETFAVNSCMVLVFSCDGWDITTIEGVGNRLEGYGEIQKRIAAYHGTQCGYCTPGFVMSIHSLLNKNPHMTMSELEVSFGSNTCRCTGYRPILDAIKSFAVDATPQLCHQLRDIEDLNIRCKESCVKPHLERQNSKEKDSESINSVGKDTEIESDDWTVIDEVKQVNMITFESDNPFIHVEDEEHVFEFLRRYGTQSYMLVNGNTAKCIKENFEYPQLLIDISTIDSLKRVYFDQNLVIGANVSLEDCIKIFEDAAETKSDEFGYLQEYAKHFKMIAHIAVRNIGSIAGNLMTKHKLPYFQSDIFVLFSAVGAMVTVRTINDARVKLEMEEFLNYNMNGVLMINVLLPPLGSKYIFKSYKVMPRSQNALAIVNAAFLLKVDYKSKSIEKISIVYGNITPQFIHAKKTEDYLKRKDIFTNSTLQTAIKILNDEVVPDDRPPYPSPACRKKVAVGLFYRFILSISPSGLVSPSLRSGSDPISRPLSHGSQDFQTDSSLYPLNQPLPKYEALLQSSGEAEYANDFPPLRGEVFGAFVTSTIAVGEIEVIDAGSISNIPGVIAVLTAKDIPGKNSFTVPEVKILQKEHLEILASKNILYYGQPVAVVVAENDEVAYVAARKVKVTYKNVSNKPPVLTIDQAKKESKRLFPHKSKIDPKGRGSDVQKVVSGVFELEGQYHYYLEPITCVVVPVEYGLDVYDSTQWIELAQAAIAQCLNITESRVNIKVRRLGGGFGGKTTSNVQASTACALVAHKLNRPCRFILPMVTNTTLSGKRLPVQCQYEAGVNDSGRIQYLNASLIEDKGCSENDNALDFAVRAFKHCYNSDYFSLKTATVHTDLPSNTFMRGPGTTEGIASIEHIMEHIAHTIDKDINEVRMKNMRQDHNDLPVLIETFKTEADYDRRAKEIEQFNKMNRWKKRAIKISPMLFPLVYEGIFTALVTTYKVDGSVTVTTGGVEMGQGVNSKARQVCAYELGIPVESVSVLANYSFIMTNNFLTASSLTSESVCYAVIKACEVLKEKLAPVKKKLPGALWIDVIRAASDEEIDLSGIYSMNSKDPNLKEYNTYAVNILEVELDILTGKFEIQRSDILEDVGLSVNPLIDVGQVEGAHIQGLGYYTLEKLVYDVKTGKLLTNRWMNYHVPLSMDIPVDLRVKLRYNSKNPKGVLGAKAVGEMGMCSAYGITHALRHCIYSSRKDSGYDTREWIKIDIPYTTESILKALDVKIEEMILNN